GPAIELGVYRQTQLLLGPGLGPPHLAPNGRMIDPDGMAMDRGGVMNASFDAALPPLGSELVAGTHAHRKQMKDTVALHVFLEHADCVWQQRTVPGRVFSSRSVPTLEMG